MSGMTYSVQTKHVGDRLVSARVAIYRHNAETRARVSELLDGYAVTRAEFPKGKTVVLQFGESR